MKEFLFRHPPGPLSAHLGDLVADVVHAGLRLAAQEEAGQHPGLGGATQPGVGGPGADM